MDTNPKKKKRIISKDPDRIILLGIYEDPEKGILIAQKKDGKEDGTFQLPGGKIWRVKHPAQNKLQLKAEYLKLTRIVFEKCGLSLDIGAVMGYYNIQNPVTQKFNLYKVFILVENSMPANKDWKRDLSFDSKFIPADLDKIRKRYPGLSWADLHILAEYLTTYPQEAVNDLGAEPKLVKPIAFIA